MKDNILFWISKDLLHFGIANSLQKNNGANLYAIIESFDKPKKFFQNQKFVNFKKTWYLDNLTTSKKHPDIEFLKSKENQYGINLWSIAYSERYFSGFTKYHVFSHDEILSFFENFHSVGRRLFYILLRIFTRRGEAFCHASRIFTRRGEAF